MPPRRRRPRGHIQELPSGSFQAIVYAGVDPLTGEERYLRETCIAASLREQISDGRRAPGELVPTTHDLAVAHNVSIATAHRAVALLTDEDLIDVSRGRRARVSASASVHT